MKSPLTPPSAFRAGFRLQADIQAYDFHVHTTNSYCARHEALTIANIAARAEQLGYRQLGISDHVYAETGVEPIERNGREIAELQTPVEVFLGVELDFPEPGKPLIDPAELLFTDYRFAAINHRSLGAKFPDLKDPQQVMAAADYWCDLVEGVLDYPVNGIVHPFHPLDKYVDGAPAFYFLYKKRRRRFMNVFRSLAKRGIALELRSDCDWFQTAAIAMRDFYRLAIDAGVKLSMATDSHWLDRLGFQVLDARCAYDINLQPEHIWHPSTPPRNQPIKRTRSSKLSSGNGLGCNPPAAKPQRKRAAARKRPARP